MRKLWGGMLVVLLALVGGTLVSPAPAAAAVASTATVYYWNDVLLNVFRRLTGADAAPTVLARGAAMMHAGVFDTLNAGQWGRQNFTGIGFIGYSGTWSANPGTDDDLAAGIVARGLLIDAFPSQRTYIEQQYTARHGATSQADATQLSNLVLTAMRSLRAGDGSAAPMTYQLDNVPGSWRPTGNGCTTPVTPQWGRVKPFTTGAITTYRRPLPGGYTSYSALLSSSLYATNVNEVKALGRFDSATRTAEQTRIAHFWANDVDGTYKPPGQLLALTRTASQGRIADPVRLSRLFAQVSLALADAAISAWDHKFQTPVDLWRPQSAIQLAGTDNNAATTADAGWLPLSADRTGLRFSPCFPAWVSGHATFAGAWAGVMRATLGDTPTWTATTDDPYAQGVTRSFTGFTVAADEDARSRVYLGVHYQFDADDGQAAGTAVATTVNTDYLKVLRCQNPCG